MSRFLTVDEAASLLRIKKSTLYSWICQKKVPSFSLGRRTLFESTELEQWVLSNRRDALGKPYNKDNVSTLTV